jgi:hypothetical protein
LEAAVAGKTLADYQSEWVIKHAVQRGIEIISEPVGCFPRKPKLCTLKSPGLG